MQDHPKTLVGTTPRSVEAAFRVLGRGGKARALKIARKAVEALAQDGQQSDGIERLVKQIEAAEADEQAVGALEAIGVRVVDRLKARLLEARKNGIDLARMLEDKVIADEKLEAEQAREAKALEERRATEQAALEAEAERVEAERKSKQKADAEERAAKRAQEQAKADGIAKAKAAAATPGKANAAKTEESPAPPAPGA